MGLVERHFSRFVFNPTSRPWRESTVVLLAVGLALGGGAGCSGQSTRGTPGKVPGPVITSDEKPEVKEKAKENEQAKEKATSDVGPGVVISTSNADGRALARLSLMPAIAPGDMLHLVAEGRVIATALVTSVERDGMIVAVTGLTDRKRLVVIGDRAELVPLEALAPAEPQAPTATAAPPSTIEPPVVAQVEHKAEPKAELKAEAPADSKVEPEGEIKAEPAPVKVVAATPPTIDPGLPPETRARLIAERAYFSLASRVLRVPATSPEIKALQERLRQELTELELLP